MEKKHTISLVLGLIGSILGLLSTVGVMLLGSLGASLGATSGNAVIGSGVSAFLIAIIALVFSCLISKFTKASAIILIFCGIIGFICSFMAFLVPAILLIVAGALALTKKTAKTV